MTIKQTFIGVVIPFLALFAIVSTSVDAAKTKSDKRELAHTTLQQNIAKSMPASKHLDSIVLGAGCFWGAEKRYQAIPGVIDAVSGYADGRGVEPTYRAITQYKNKRNPNNHAEVVKVTFNQSVVSLETILQSYFEGHDPTQLNRQGNDVGTQYRSTILTNSNQQAEVANQVLTAYQLLLDKVNHGKIVTKNAPLTEFFPAEDYHQDYLAKNPNGYCPDHATGVRFNARPFDDPPIDNTVLLKGKHIIVIESKNHCPYCEKFKLNVLDKYQGDIPITLRYASQLQGLSIKTPTWATPTVLFIEDGKEVHGKQGYMTPDKFYAAVGKLQK